MHIELTDEEIKTGQNVEKFYIMFFEYLTYIYIYLNTLHIYIYIFEYLTYIYIHIYIYIIHTYIYIIPNHTKSFDFNAMSYKNI